ncbi:uncharacterized protein VTP21DRAFT_3909 [Calcarisporiella thermophila]|uniref:uncharacterized protein n=1 Tax=Calcarisporiella thermophila TaxID=911321 RepID=UPI0037437C26
MSVVGIDFGSLQSVIAVARNRGIDVITNEVSNRATPSLVSFGSKQRYLGEAAKSQEISNFKNTVGSLKRLAGRSFQDPEIQQIEKQYINAELVDVNGQVGVKVNYLEQETIFSSTQLIAMYLGKLRDIAAKELKIPVSDVVISVPAWFTDAQRRAILDASEIANLNVLRLINDTTAAALGYGITKTDLPEDKPRNVVFVDVGYSDYTVTVVSYLKGQLTVLATACDRHLGGRNFDQVLVDHFAEEFKQRYHIDIKSNNKALFRLRAGCEKLKKVLSANPQAPFNVESIMNDVDVSAMLTRVEFETLSAHLLDRVEAPLREALQAAGLDVADIHSIELVGGSTRIPSVKERVSKFFGKEVSTTLNQDEAIARGCALQCASLSPVFKVREFQVHDISLYPIKFTWAPTPEEEDTELVVFQRTNPIPSSKILTFYRNQPFEIEAQYAEPETLPTGVNPWIGRFMVKKVEPIKDGELAQVKVKARLNLHGVVSIEGAYVAEEVVKEVEPEAMETDKANGAEPPKEGAEAEKPAAKKVKKIVKKHELPVVKGTTSLDSSLVAELREKEAQMCSSDKLVEDTEERRNALEEYVYEMRGKLEMQYSDYVDDATKDKFLQLLNEMEEWLYTEEGEESTKSVYVGKLEELLKYGQPITERYREAEARPHAERHLRETIEQFVKNALSTEERFAHISPEEKQQVVDRCERARRWLDEMLQKQAAVPLCETPVVFARDIIKEREELVHFATPILTKPKPKPAPEPTKADSPKPDAATPEQDAQKPPNGTSESPKPEDTKGDKPEMDVD